MYMHSLTWICRRGQATLLQLSASRYSSHHTQYNWLMPRTEERTCIHWPAFVAGGQTTLLQSSASHYSSHHTQNNWLTPRTEVQSGCWTFRWRSFPSSATHQRCAKRAKPVKTMLRWLIITFWRNVLDKFQHKRDNRRGRLIGRFVGWFKVLPGTACSTFLASTHLSNGQIEFLMWKGERGRSHSCSFIFGRDECFNLCTKRMHNDMSRDWTLQISHTLCYPL